MSDRTVLLDEPEVSCAADELTVAGSRFTRAEIRSVEMLRVPTAATGPILMIAVGAICLLSAAGGAGLTRAALGVAFLVGAAAWWSQKKPTFQVVVRTEHREAIPFESRDERAATRVRDAIVGAQPSAHRGE